MKQLNGSWTVGVQITSLQEKVISSNTGNLDNNAGNVSRVLKGKMPQITRAEAKAKAKRGWELIYKRRNYSKRETFPKTVARTPGTPLPGHSLTHFSLLQRKAEIADGKYLTIEGFGTVIGHSIMPHKKESLQIQNVLYIPEANKWLFLLIAMGQHGSMSQTTKEGTTISKNGTPFIIGTPKSGKLHSFDMVLANNPSEVPRVIIAMLSDYTLWHQRMGHAH